MLTPTREQRERLRALALKATPGPWESVRKAGLCTVREHGRRLMTGGRSVAAVAMCNRVVSSVNRHKANAAFIAACDPQTILALLDRLDALEPLAAAAIKERAWRNRHVPGHEGPSNCTACMSKSELEAAIDAAEAANG